MREPKYIFNKEPIPHLIKDDFLPAREITDVHNCFPQSNSSGWRGKYTKLEMGSSPEFINPSILNLLSGLCSPDFCSTLSTLFNKPQLYGSIIGAGPQITHSGDHLDMHFDWMMLNNKYRSLNLHLYLNDDWQPEFNGQLRIGKTISIDPLFNRLVIYKSSMVKHGHPSIWRGIRPRKALTVYYFTDFPDVSITNFQNKYPDYDLIHVIR